MTKSNWKMTQNFKGGSSSSTRKPGNNVGKSGPSSDNDLVTAVEFDEAGDFLAMGDKGGRISILSRNRSPSTTASESPTRQSNHYAPEYSRYTEFQSHDAEFDYLKSLEIEEKINQIKWCKPSNDSLFLLSTNDKTIKLWKVRDKQIGVVTSQHHDTESSSYVNASAIKFPTVTYNESAVPTAYSKRVYSNAHAYHINSIALNSDCDHYLSADDLRINLWNLGISNQSFNIVDIKPANMEELTEVITAADFHPTHCNIMMYSSSRGSIKLGDMREAALCDSHAKVFEEPEDPETKSFFSEIIASISDVKFSQDGRYVISRDYLTLKIWDLNMESSPVKVINIHEQLRPKLCDLYENDCIFDKFECSVSGSGSKYVTGSYHNLLHIYDEDESDVCIEAGAGGVGGKVAGKGRRHSMPNTAAATSSSSSSSKPGDIDVDSMNFTQKVLHTAWHPVQDEIAVATGSDVFIYCNRK